MHMMWNGKPYYDHPPMGFWFMALSYRLFGISEFSTRLPSAVAGLLTILFVYLFAVELFGKKTIGFVASLILGTSVWYLIRVRSGNLESIFVFFYILTVYLSLKSSKDFRWFPLVMISFGALVLAKTLVGVSAIVLILFLNVRQFFKKKHIGYVLLGIGGFIALVYPWYKVQMSTYSDFIQHHFFTVGMRDKTIASYFKLMIDQPFFYLHMGVRKWYYIWLLSIGYLVISLTFLKKHIFFLFLWNFIVLYPFLTSEKTELWHLIPVYLALSFISSVGVYEALFFVRSILLKILPHTSMFKIITREHLYTVTYLLFFATVAVLQIRVFTPEVFAQTRYTPDDVAISKLAGKYNKTLYLDDDFVPLAVYYSDTIVYPLAYQPDDKKTLVKLFQSPEKNFIVITRNWAINNLKKDNIPYKIVDKNNSFTIVTRP